MLIRYNIRNRGKTFPTRAKLCFSYECIINLYEDQLTTRIITFQLQKIYISNKYHVQKFQKFKKVAGFNPHQLPFFQRDKKKKKKIFLKSKHLKIFITRTEFHPQDSPKDYHASKNFNHSQQKIDKA